MRKILGLATTAAVVLGIQSQPACLSAETASEAKEANDLTNPECKIDCVDPHAACPESSKVIEVLQQLVKAINNGDWKTYEEMLDDHCSTFDENSKKLIAGKENVMNDMKQKAEKYAQHGSPFLSVTIDHPYAKVTGDTAVVTFLAIRQYGGKHPFKEECRAVDIFVKHGDNWKKCHFRGAWKRV